VHSPWRSRLCVDPVESPRIEYQGDDISVLVDGHGAVTTVFNCDGIDLQALRLELVLQQFARLPFRDRRVAGPAGEGPDAVPATIRTKSRARNFFPGENILRAGPSHANLTPG
jgi:hypothetical protein